jgi:tetratricopeptide (TPR) repeat protein
MSAINWNEILGWNENNLEDLRFIGYSYLKQGKFDIALSLYEALVLLNPASAYDLQTLGALYLETGNNLLALNTIESALKIEPTHDATLLNRAKALFALGFKRQAIAQARALELAPNREIANQASALLLAYT